MLFQAAIRLDSDFVDAIGLQFLTQSGLGLGQQVWIFKTDMDHGKFFQTVCGPDIELGNSLNVFNRQNFLIKLTQINIARDMLQKNLDVFPELRQGLAENEARNEQGEQRVKKIPVGKAQHDRDQNNSYPTQNVL